MSIVKTVTDIKCYQVFIYQEISPEIPKIDEWQQVGEVSALSLPMACTISDVYIKNDLLLKKEFLN